MQAIDVQEAAFPEQSVFALLVEDYSLQEISLRYQVFFQHLREPSIDYCNRKNGIKKQNFLNFVVLIFGTKTQGPSDP